MSQIARRIHRPLAVLALLAGTVSACSPRAAGVGVGLGMVVGGGVVLATNDPSRCSELCASVLYQDAAGYSLLAVGVIVALVTLAKTQR